MAVTDDGTPYVEPGDAISAYPTVSQELAAVIDSLRTMIPVGAIFPYAGKIAPEGYLFCDGKAYTRTDFYDLYTVMAEWVGEWGGFPGGNSAQFFVPDMRGRAPFGVAGGTGFANGLDGSNNPARAIGLGQRFGDHRLLEHMHFGELVSTQTGTGQGAFSAWTGDTRFASGPIYNAAHAGADSMPPYTGVNFIVWTGTTTTGKNPVAGVELAPVTTRMMIEARLEEAGIGEEEIEMLREQLKELETADA